MNKDRHIIAELNSIFAESDNTKAIQGIMNVMSHITLDHRQMDFAIKNSLNFAGSVLGQMFACKNDMFTDNLMSHLESDGFTLLSITS